MRSALPRSAVLASVKVRNLKANHNWILLEFVGHRAVLASVKVRNLKANHNADADAVRTDTSVKVRNLKANHNGRSYEEVEF